MTATVTDAGTPVAGVRVYFSLNDIVNTYNGYCVFSGFCTSDVTGADGKATYTYSSDTERTDTIYAFADTNANVVREGSEPGNSASKIWRSNPAATLTALTPETGPDLFVDLQERCVSGFAQDSQGAPSVRPVVFTVTGANPQTATRTSDTGGGVSFCYTGQNGGDDTITAFVDNDSDGSQDVGEPSNTPPNPTQHWRVDAPDALELTPATATNDVGTNHTVTATVTDAGTPVAGVRVYFSLNDIVNTYNGYCVFSGFCTSDVTGADGKATYTYSSDTERTDTIYAFADTNANVVREGSEPGNSASKIWQRTDFPASLTLDPRGLETTVTSVSSCVTANVRDASDNPTTSAWTVRFSVTGANPQTATRTSDTSGNATFCYTGDNAGPDTISAFADTDGNGSQDSGEPGDTGVAKRWVAEPPDTVTVAVTPESTFLPIHTLAPLTAKVTDAGDPLPRVKVLWTVTGPNGPQSSTSTTNENGDAQFELAGGFRDTDTIRAVADTDLSGTENAGEQSDSGTITWTEEPPTALALEPNTETLEVGGNRCITGTVTDSSGHLQGNRLVRFSVTGANDASDEVFSGFSGEAEFCYTGQNGGDDDITAFVDTDEDGTQDPGEPGNTATTTWTTPRPELSVTKSGSGDGRVTSDPAGIDCGSTCQASFAAQRDRDADRDSPMATRASPAGAARAAPARAMPGHDGRGQVGHGHLRQRPARGRRRRRPGRGRRHQVHVRRHALRGRRPASIQLQLGLRRRPVRRSARSPPHLRRRPAPTPSR